RSQIGVTHAARNSRGTGGGGSSVCCGRAAPLTAAAKSAKRAIAFPAVNATCSCSRFAGFLGVVSMFDDVAFLEQDATQRLLPFGFFSQQEFEIHAEVFHLFVLSVLHDGLRIAILLDGQSLLVPSDRLGFFDERCDHARERARLF